MVVFDANKGSGKVLLSSSTPYEWSSIVPGSVGDEIFSVVCKNAPLKEEKSEKLEQLVNVEIEKINCQSKDYKYDSLTTTNSRSDWLEALSILKEIQKSCKLDKEKEGLLAYRFAEAYYRNEKYYRAIGAAKECIRLNKKNDSIYVDSCRQTKIFALGKSGGEDEAFAEINQLGADYRKLINQKRSALLNEKLLGKRFDLERNIDVLESTVPKIYYEIGKYEMAYESANQCLKGNSTNMECHGIKIQALDKLGRKDEFTSALDSAAATVSAKSSSLKAKLDSSNNTQDREILRTKRDELGNVFEFIKKVKETGHMPSDGND